MNDPHQGTSKASAQADTRYFMVVGALLGLIIAALAALWLRERARRVSAEQALALVRQQQQRAQEVLGRLMSARVAEAVRPVARDDLPRETVTWNGRQKSVLRIGAAAGKRFGFAPGDVIVVSPEASPASQPGDKEAGDGGAAEEPAVGRGGRGRPSPPR